MYVETLLTHHVSAAASIAIKIDATRTKIPLALLIGQEVYAKYEFMDCLGDNSDHSMLSSVNLEPDLELTEK